jgi:hypothetical protein
MSIHSNGLGKGHPLGTTPRYCSIADWCTISGMSRSGTYEALGRGDLRAIKLGVRTLVDVEHGLACLASLPAAKITTSRSRRTVATVTLVRPSARPRSQLASPHPTRHRRASSVRSTADHIEETS